MAVTHLVESCPKILTMLSINANRHATTLNPIVSFHGQRYKLFYIQHQTGPSINNARSGHFFSEVFSDGTWYQCNDETVTTLKGPTLTSSSVCFTAYVAIEEINLALTGQSSMTLTGEHTARSTGSRAQRYRVGRETVGQGALNPRFSGPLASRNPNTGNNSKPIGFQNRFDAFDKGKNNRGFEYENNFQEVNQQNSSTRFFCLA
jgi:hypothetical protein